jgi:alpha-tubulin suppressor-like RCC1 family protein
MRNGFACGIAGVSVLATLVAAEACSSSSSSGASPAVEDAGLFADTTIPAEDAGFEDASANPPLDAGTASSDAATFSGLHCNTPPCVIALAAGGGHVCALFDDHGVRCWGQNYAGELGIGTIDAGQVTPAQTPTPTLVPALANVASVAAGGYSNGLGITCATPADGGVVCWGSNERGGLGLGPNDGGAPIQSFVPLPLDVSGAVQLALGGLFSCALTIDGGVSCWGDDTQRQLGRTLEAGASFDPTPSPVTLPGAATAVATGISHACALLADQSVVCWGAADHGQIGQLVDGGVAMPQTVSGVTATQVSAGEVSTCAITPSGGVSCWGGNQSGQLGRGDAGGDASTDPMAKPVALPAGATAVQLASAAGSTCALLSDHTAWCWGDNAYGELGTGSLIPGFLPAPTPVQGLSNVVQLASGPGGYTVCALLDDSSVRCWGANYADQLGVDTSGDAGKPDESPHPVPLRVTF